MTVPEAVGVGLGFLAIVAPDFWPKMPRRLSYILALIGLSWLTYSLILGIQELSGAKLQQGPIIFIVVGAVCIAGGIFWHISRLDTKSKTIAPYATFIFSKGEPYVVSAEKRSKFEMDSWRISVGFKSARRLTNATPKIVSAQFLEGKEWKSLFPSRRVDNLAWDDYERGFKPRTIVPDYEELIVMFHYWPQRKALDMVNERNEGEFKNYKNMPVGKYRFVIRVDSDDFTISPSKKVYLNWDGDPEKLEMAISDK